MRKQISRLSLTFHTAILVFIFHSLTLLMTAFLMYLANVFGVFKNFSESSVWIPFSVTLVACTIMGLFISICASKKILRAVHLFIEAMEKLSRGDFSARLQLTHTPEYRMLSDNFNRMAEELAGIEVLRTDFINNFSHEFKTPIVSIKGFAEILKDDNLSKEERDEYLDIVIEESARLATLASNVLTLSNVENQMILTDQQTFNIGEQLRQAILILDSKMAKKDIYLNVSVEDINFYGNKEMLHQVWINLIDNAIKFVSEKGMIEVNLQQKDEEIIVRIMDTGCGISKENIPKIFDKFYQADDSHATIGNGLGLSIVHKIITLHEGSIECDSVLGRGTCFTVTLPMRQA